MSDAEPLPANKRFEAFGHLADALLPAGEGVARRSTRRSARRETASIKGNQKEGDYRATVSAASLRMHGKLFAISAEQKLACLVPLDAIKGDVVCVVFGCNFPLVLRRFGDMYWLVGEAYVHGIMKGQSMKGVSAVGHEIVDFALK